MTTYDYTYYPANPQSRGVIGCWYQP
jgi:hypothetical protein